MSADAAKFILEDGVLAFFSAPDFENPTDSDTDNGYEVTVRVQDTNGATADLALTVNVTDVDEKPATPAAPSVSATANSTTSLDVSWTAPGLNGGPALTGYEVQYRISGSWTNWSHTGTGTSAAITGLTAGQSYEVQVRALNGETPSDWSPSGTGSTTSADATLSPAFASDTYAYTATVGNSVSQITVTPTKTDDGATVEYLDTNDAAIADADGNATGQQVDLVVGANVIKVKVTAEDGATTQTYMVTVTRNTVPVFDTTSPLSVLENATAVTTIVATDADGDDLSWFIIMSADAAKFILEDGVLAFFSAPDFENPTDSDTDNGYEVTVRVQDTNGATADLALTVNVTDVNEKPATPAAPSVSATAGSTTSLDVSWIAPGLNDGPALTGYEVQYRISGSWTNWPHTGTATTAAITGLTAGQSYEVQVRALNGETPSDWSPSGTGSTSTPTNAVPVITTTSPQSVAENTTAVATLTATDTDSGDTLTWSTNGGADAAKFSLTTGGVLSFASAPDFEDPTDTGADNGYEVTVRVSDGTATADLALTVNVTDVDEKPATPAVPSVSATAGSTTSLDVSWIAPGLNGGPALTGYEVQYRISGSWTNWPHTGTAVTAAITGLTAGTSYEVQVRALNGETPSDWSPSGTGSTSTPSNAVPVITTTSPQSVAENTTAVATLTATDTDIGDTLTWSTNGGADAAKFSLTTGGVLSFASAPDFEDPTDTGADNGYEVTVRVSDGTATADLALTVNVTDVDEKPATPAVPSVSATAGSTTSLDVSWIAPGLNGGPALTGYEVQYRISGSWTNWPHTGTATTAAITGLTAGQSYEVQVRALNGETPSDWSPSGTGSTSTPSNNPATGKPTISGTPQVGEKLTAETSGIGDPDGVTNATFSYQWVSYDGTDDTDISRATKSTYWPSADDVGMAIKVKVSFTDDASNAEELTSDATATVVAVPVTAVPADWSLTPSGLGAGERFRLLFLSSSSRNAVPTDIDTYNTWVQSLTDSGHTDIQDYSSTFRIVGSTEAVDARDNTGTTYTSSDKGVAIYWLNGNKAADQYEDFYDESWDQEATMRTQAGATVSAPTSVYTGSNHNGTESFSGVSLALGRRLVGVGKPNSTVSGNGPLTGAGTDASEFLGLYGLSGVFSVSPPGETVWSATLTVGESTVGSITNIGYQPGTGTLAPTQFTYMGESRQVTRLITVNFSGARSLRFSISSPLPPSLESRDLQLYLDETTFLIEALGSETGVSISDHGLTWTEGQVVRVWLTVNREPSGNPAITGTAEVGKTLTAETAAITDPDGTANAVFTYQWVRVDGGTETDISGATGSTYKLVDDDEDKTIKVQVSYTDNAGFAESLTSGATAIVPSGTVVEIWSGTLTVGQKITEGGGSTDTKSGFNSGATSSLSPFGNLVPRTFTYNGVEFTVEGLFHQRQVTTGGHAFVDFLTLTTDPVLESGNFVFVLYLDGEPFSLSAAYLDHEFPGLRWIVGQEVQVRLTARGQTIDLDLRLNVQTLSWNAIDPSLTPEGHVFSHYEVQRRQVVNGVGRHLDTWCNITVETLTWCAFTSHSTSYEFPPGAKIIRSSAQFEYDLRVRAVYTGNQGADVKHSPWSETFVYQYPERVGEAPAGLRFELHNPKHTTPDLSLVVDGVYVCSAWFDFFLEIGPQPADEYGDVCSVLFDEALNAAITGIPVPPKPRDCVDECTAEVKVIWDRPTTPTGETLTGYRLQSRDVNSSGPLAFQHEAAPDHLGKDATHYWERSEWHDENDPMGDPVTLDPGFLLFTPNQSFEYRMVAVYDSGKWSPWSEVLHVTLPPGCSPGSAPCTGPQQPGAQTAGASLDGEALPQPDPLRASFKEWPAVHDGESAISLRIEFSEDIAASAADMRDHALGVSGGTVTSAGVDGRDDLWLFTITPSGTSSVMIELAGERACSEAGAICTADGRPLGNSLAGLLVYVPPPEAPGEPEMVRITGDTSNSLTVSWQPPENDGGSAVTEYIVQWITIGENFGTARRDGREAVVGDSARSHTITGLEEGEFYMVLVLAVNEAGESEASGRAWGFPGLGKDHYGHY